jgi:hypothetical protein
MNGNDSAFPTSKSTLHPAARAEPRLRDHVRRNVDP